MHSNREVISEVRGRNFEPVGLRRVASGVALVVAMSLPQVANAADGAQAFKNACGACHSTNLVHRIGPTLVGVVGRVSGTAPDFEYSEAIRKAAIKWDKATLDKFLTTPNSVVSGTKMSFPGLKDRERREAIVEFVASLDVK